MQLEQFCKWGHDHWENCRSQPSKSPMVLPSHDMGIMNDEVEEQDKLNIPVVIKVFQQQIISKLSLWEALP